MIKLLRLALLFGLILATMSHAENEASLSEPVGYIDDYAHVLSAPATEQLETECRELHAKTHAQLFLVTIRTLAGDTKEDFANQLFAKWKIGEKKTDRGVLILLAIDDHKRWIEVGYGLEGILNDAKVGDIGREMVPALKAGNYDEAARVGVHDVVKVIAADSNVTLDSRESPSAVAAEATPASSGQSAPLWLIPIVLCCGCGGVIFFLAMRSARRRADGPQPSAVPTSSGSTYYDSTPLFIDNSSGVAASDSLAPSSDTSGGFSGSVAAAPDTSSSFSDSFSGGDGGMSGGGGAGGDW
jgi:uncharacterized protein